MFFIFVLLFDEIQVSKQNSRRWEQRFAASHLGLFCLPISHKKDTRFILVNIDVTTGPSHPFHLDDPTLIFRTIKSNFSLLFLFFHEFQ